MKLIFHLGFFHIIQHTQIWFILHHHHSGFLSFRSVITYKIKTTTKSNTGGIFIKKKSPKDSTYFLQVLIGYRSCLYSFLKISLMNFHKVFMLRFPRSPKCSAFQSHSLHLTYFYLIISLN